MPDRVFITDTRREVLDGEFEGKDSTLGSHKSRIRTRARIALNELIEIAESDEIDNEDVFSPEDLGALVAAILDDVTPLPSDLHRSDQREGFGDELSDHYREYSYEHAIHGVLMNTLTQQNPEGNLPHLLPSMLVPDEYQEAFLKYNQSLSEHTQTE